MSIFSRLSRRAPRNESTGNGGELRKECAYGGVEIVFREGACCAAVRALAGQRILAGDAPVLPLKDCDKAVCCCKYQRFLDRRTDTRRDADLGFGTAGAIVRQADKCRRMKKGRRNTDRES